jgi:hypothetical protein
MLVLQQQPPPLRLSYRHMLQEDRLLVLLVLVLLVLVLLWGIRMGTALVAQLQYALGDSKVCGRVVVLVVVRVILVVVLAPLLVALETPPSTVRAPPKRQ